MCVNLKVKKNHVCIYTLKFIWTVGGQVITSSNSSNFSRVNMYQLCNLMKKR